MAVTLPDLVRRPKAALSCRPELSAWLFPHEIWRSLNERVELVAPVFSGADWREHQDKLREVEILIGSWGISTLDQELLDAMPHLRAVLYGAGTVREFIRPAFWRRNILLSTAANTNAGPTAAFAEAMIILSLKHTWFYLRKNLVGWPSLQDTASSGVHGATIGIIGLSRVGREVVRGLQRHEVTILVSDPTVMPAQARQLGVELADLASIFSRSDVVSLHAPLLSQTTGMISGELLRLMKPHATFVNTARGAIVREPEMIAVLRERPDLTAVLDVSDPEPAPADSPLRSLANVVLTPHLAGARHREIGLIGRTVMDELDLFLRGHPLRCVVDEAAVKHMA